MKAERLPGWEFRRLSDEQKLAVVLLRDEPPRPPAERARLKLLLGWKRTREETVGLLVELVERGMVRSAIREELEVSDRHLRRLLAELAESGVWTSENRPANPHGYAADSDTTCKSDTGVHPGRSSAPVEGFASFAELDRWLEELG